MKVSASLQRRIVGPTDPRARRTGDPDPTRGSTTSAALAVAITKGSLVILFFMGVRWNTPLTKTVAISGFLWLLILFGMTMNDYLTRVWLGVAGR